METSTISSHYEAVSDHYHTSWWSQPAYTEQIDALLHHYLHLIPSSRLVDLGGGTGDLAASLRERAMLTVPVMCVDPSQGMLEMVANKEGVTTLCMGAEEWSVGGEEGDCDRVVIKQAVHHFDRAKLPETLSGIWKRLSPGGRLVIEKGGDTYGGQNIYPEKVITIMDSTLISRVEFEKLLRQAGFELLETHRHEFLIHTPKAELLHSYRSRIVSALAQLSDAEIEEGIKEIDAKHPGDIVTFINVRDIMVGCKLP